MRNIWVIIPLLFFIHVVKAQDFSSPQERYSKRFHLEHPAAIFTGIIATDSCYYLNGVIADSIAPHNAGNIFAHFSLDGSPIMIKLLLDTTRTYETWRGSLIKQEEDVFVNLGYTIDSLFRGMLIVFNATTGDTLKTVTYLHPSYPDVVEIIPRDLALLEDGYLILNMIRSPNDLWDVDIEVMKVSFNGIIEWRRTYGFPYHHDEAYSIIPQANGYIVAGIRDNSEDVARNYIFESDWDGDIIWSYHSPFDELRGKEGHAILTNDGGLLVYTGNGSLHGTIGEWRFHNYVFKLDSNQEEEWNVYVRDSLEAKSYINELTSAIELNDGTGYVVAGNLAEYHPERSWHVGLLAKISPDGALLWQRHYQHLEGAWYRHYINDMAVAPDGGFIMVGEVRDTVDAPRQQGWLLKVDQYGCLVPGCHLLDDVVDVEESQNMPFLLLYPNPAQDELRIYFKGQRGDYDFRIIDIAGRIWQEFETPLNETTILLDVQQWAGGMYFLQCFQEGKIIKSERFIISH